MPWARFADDYLGNQKLATLSTSAIALDMAGIIYSARELRDGHLSKADVQAMAALIHLRRWEPAAGELVAVCRWVLETGGWCIHDYLEYQPARAEVLAERQQTHSSKVAAGRAGGLATAKQKGQQKGSPVPGPGSNSKNLTPAGSGSSLAARDHARDADPKLLADHLALIAAERASHAKPSQPSQNSSETNGKSDGAGR
jgi:hypothetical protein